MAEHRQLLTALLLFAGGAAAADEAADDMPDMALLEYLGSWDGDEEDWLLFEEDVEQQADANEKRSDPAGRSQESQESEHES